MGENRLLSGMLQFQIEAYGTEFKNELTALQMAILVIVNRLAQECLNSVYSSVLVSYLLW